MGTTAHHRSQRLAACLLLAAITVAGCGGDDDEGGDEAGGEAGAATTAAGAPAPTAAGGAATTATDGDATTVAPTAETTPATEAAVSEPPIEDLKVAVSQLPAFLDPRLANPQSKMYMSLLFDHLIGLDHEGRELSEETGIASGWSSDDSQTWTVTLRDDFTFSNGEELTSSDVVFSINRVLDEAATSPNAATLRGLIASVEAPDPQTVVFTLTRPDFSFPYYMSPNQGTEGMIVPEDYVTEVGDEGFGAAPIGTGPYTLTDANPGVSVSFDWRADDHPVYAVPRYGSLTFTSVPAQSTRTAMLETGEVDLIDVDLSTLDPATLEEEDFGIFEKVNQNVLGVQLHGQAATDSLTSNEQFREALAMAINKEEIQQTVYRGYGELTGVAFGGSQGIGYEPLEPYPYDPDAARALLEEIGYDGRAVDVYATDIAGVPGMSQTANAIAGYLADVGINAQIQNIDFASFRPLWFDEQIPGAISPIGIANRLLPHTIYLTQFRCEGDITYACDPDFDAIVNAMLAELGEESAYAGYAQEANQYIHDHYMSIPILEVGTFYAGNEDVPADWTLGTGQYDINTPGLIALG